MQGITLFYNFTKEVCIILEEMHGEYKVYVHVNKINGKIYKFPKIMTEGEWARCMQILAKVYRKDNV